ncbi:hypothetical protein AB0A73_13370 [Glycomyces sp. NPDC047369]
MGDVDEPSHRTRGELAASRAKAILDHYEEERPGGSELNPAAATVHAVLAVYWELRHHAAVAAANGTDRTMASLTNALSDSHTPNFNLARALSEHTNMMRRFIEATDR